MTIDKSALKALAEAATPGPWGYDGSYVCPARVEDGTTYVETWRSVADCVQPENTKFIAAANPTAVMVLLAEIEQLSKDLESHKRMLLNAAISMGAIGEAMGAEMDDDVSELEGLAIDLRKDAGRYLWLLKNWFTMSSEYKDDVVFLTGRARWSDLPEDAVSDAIDAEISKESSR